MSSLYRIREKIDELKKESTEVEERYKKISSLMHFPIIKSYLEDLNNFVKREYLLLIRYRNLSKMSRKLESLLKNGKEHRISLEILLENSELFGMENFDVENTLQVENSKEELEIKNIYETFLDKLYFEKEVEFYKLLLGEKIKVKREKIRNLNTEIMSKLKDKDIEQFIFFLKNYIPVHGKIRHINMSKTKKIVFGAGIPNNMIFIKEGAIEKMDQILQKKQKMFDRINFKFRNKQEVLDFYNYLQLVASCLEVKKKYELQKIFIADFFLRRARKFFSILYEDNKANFKKVSNNFEKAKEDNRNLKKNIRMFKMDVVKNLHF
jgi:hypothetical protein